MVVCDDRCSLRFHLSKPRMVNNYTGKHVVTFAICTIYIIHDISLIRCYLGVFIGVLSVMEYVLHRRYTPTPKKDEFKVFI